MPDTYNFLLASIVESSEDAILSMDFDGIVTSWNTGSEKMFGYSSKEIMGKSIYSIYPTGKESEFDEIIAKLKKNERIEHFETERKRKDGSLIYVSLSISPINNEKGNIVGIAKIIRDISGQKRASAYARSLIEASLDPLVTISAKGKVTDVNEATVKITGVQRENLIGSDFSDYFTEPKKAREGYERVFKEGFVADYPLSIRNSSGQITDVLYNASVYKDDKGNVLGVFAAARDITERKKVEKLQAEQTDTKEKLQAEQTDTKEKLQAEYTLAKEKLQLEYTDAKEKRQAEQTLAKEIRQAEQTLAKETRQAEQTLAKEVSEKLKGVAKDEFSAMITHELNTPLVPILGYCKMLKTSMLGKIDQEQLEAIEVIEKNAKRLEALIADIMDVRKLDLNQLKFRIDDLSLDEFFSNLDSDYGKVLENKKCQFTTNPYAKNLVIKTDKSRLRQVFDNLIGNAIKFVPENKGKIETGCMKENNSLVFYVRDNGIGISQEKQKELFQKFYQIDTSERRSIGGTGLGLAISKGIVEKLGGTISVESDGKTGTTFYMKFLS
ncbi:PAS domain S-box protein [Candidatus Nitrosotalea bavarica]|uniref:PAS domain S-box protein n=1 Tax=Candidatus Nitrosotalea bavarica TaxID=1903277 RepID=UPI000C70B309|nr:PAS domain S-box protein [Candidatus Nitrosotalea bavarica]